MDEGLLVEVAVGFVGVVGQHVYVAFLGEVGLLGVVVHLHADLGLHLFRY